MNRLSLDSNAVPAHIGGISCNVRNCTYHDGESFCTAHNVKVGPSYATSSVDTVCATFKPKSM